MTKIIKNETRVISIYLEEQYLDEIVEIRIKKLINERKEFERKRIEIRNP